MSDVILSSSVRNNLFSLQQTSSLLEVTQNRLSTGKRVSSALDNPNNFFTASALSDRAKDLSNLLDGIGQSIQAIKAADAGISAISKLVEAAEAKAVQALQTSDVSDRAAFAEEYNELLSQIYSIAGDSIYKGKNLLGGDELSVIFNEDSTSQLTISGADYTDPAGLGINDAELTVDITDPLNPITTQAWETDALIETSIEELKDALGDLRTQATSFGTSLTVVQNRQDFTKSLINTLEIGSDKLIIADQNFEGAKLLALQTRQQISIQSLALAAQADQNILRLF